MPHIYVTYRTLDINRAERDLIVTQLERAFGKENIIVSPATDDGEIIHLRRAVADADVLLVLMGEHYLTMVDEEGLRLIDNPLDYHHAEIVAAVEAKLWLGVILLEHEIPAKQQLPSPLRPIVTDSTIFDLRDIQQVAAVVDDFKRQLVKDNVRRNLSMFPAAKKRLQAIKNNPRRWRRVSFGIQASIVFIIASIVLAWFVRAPNPPSIEVDSTAEPILTRSAQAYATTQAQLATELTQSPLRLSQEDIAATQITSIRRYVDLAGGAENVMTASANLREISASTDNLRLIAIEPALRGRSFDFSSDSDWLVAADGQHVNLYFIRQLNRTSTEDITFRTNVIDVIFSDDDDYIIILTENNDEQNDLWLYAHETYSINFVKRVSVPKVATIMDAVDGRLYTNTGHTYLLPSLQQLNASDLPAGVVAHEQIVYEQSDGKIVRLRVGDDGNLYRNGIIERNVPPHAQLAYSDNAKRYVVNTGTILTYYTNALNEFAKQDGIGMSIIDMVAHPSEPLIALVADTRVLLRSVYSDTTILSVDMTDISDIGFSPDGTILAIATASGDILFYGDSLD